MNSFFFDDGIEDKRKLKNFGPIVIVEILKQSRNSVI